MKRLLQVLGIIVLIIVIAVVALRLYFNDQRLKETVMPYVDEAVGRPVQVDQMSLALFRNFPNVGLRIDGVVVPGDAEGDTLASLKQMVVGVEVLPLLSSEVEISELLVVQPRFTYLINEDGSSNIDFLMGDKEEVAPADTQETATTSAINIPSFLVRDARIRYIDRTANTRMTLNKVDADIALKYGDKIESSIDLQLGGVSAEVEGVRYLDALPVSLKQRSVIDLAGEQVELQEGTFSIRGLRLSLNGTVSDWSKTPMVDLEFSSQSGDFSELLRLVPAAYKDQIEGLETRGTLALEGSVNGAVGGEELPSFQAGMQVKDGYLKYPDLPVAVEDIQVNGRASNSELVIEAFEARAGSNTMSMNGRLEEPLKGAGPFRLQAGAELDLATIKDFYPIDEDTLEMRGMMTADVRLQGMVDKPQEAIEQGTIELNGGYIAYHKLPNPVRELTMRADLQGDRIRLSNTRVVTGSNSLELSGSIERYFSDQPVVDLQSRGTMAFSEFTDYVSMEPYISNITGEAEMNLSVRGPVMQVEQLKFNGDLNVSGVNIDGDSLPQPVRNLNARMELTPEAASLKRFNTDFGSSDLQVSGSLVRYMAFLDEDAAADGLPRLTGSVKSGMLNFDEWIDWEAEADTTLYEYPIHLPEMTASVSMEVDTMLMTGVSITDIKGTANTTPKRVTIEDASARMFDGSMAGSMVWNVPRPERTNLTFNGRLDTVEAAAFFEEFAIMGEDSDFHEYVSGSFSAQTNYYTEIDVYLSPVIPSTKSEGSFGMTKMRLKGHPAQEKVADLLKTPRLANAAMDKWQSSYTIENSVLTLKDLRLTSGNVGGELNGTQHLESGRMDFGMRLYLPGSVAGRMDDVLPKQAVKALEQDNGTVMLPVSISGTADNPKVGPDMDTIEPIVKQYLKDQAKDKAKDAVKGLLDRFN